MSKHLNDSADSFKSQPEVQAELKTSNEAELRERAEKWKGCDTCEGRFFPARGVPCPDCGMESQDE